MKRLSSKGFDLAHEPKTESEFAEWAKYLLADAFHRELDMTADEARAAVRSRKAKTIAKDNAHD